MPLEDINAVKMAEDGLHTFNTIEQITEMGQDNGAAIGAIIGALIILCIFIAIVFFMKNRIGKFI